MCRHNTGFIEAVSVLYRGVSATLLITKHSLKMGYFYLMMILSFIWGISAASSPFDFNMLT